MTIAIIQSRGFSSLRNAKGNAPPTRSGSFQEDAVPTAGLRQREREAMPTAGFANANANANGIVRAHIYDN